jgi:hypothetical protein
VKIQDVLDRRLGIVVAILFFSVSPAKAIDEKEANFVKVSTLNLFMTLMCDDYVAIPEVLQYLGQRSIGADRTETILKAVGSEFAKTMRQGGLKLGKGGEPADLIPDVSKIVDDNMNILFGAYNDNKAKTCQQIGDMSVKEGQAKKIK